MPATAIDRGDKVKTRCPDVACLDAGCALVATKQAVMVAVDPPAKSKTAGFEIFKITRKVTLDCNRQRGHIAGGTDLPAVW